MVKLTTIRNGPKQTISASAAWTVTNGIIEQVTEWCVNKNAWAPKKVDYDISCQSKMKTKHFLLFKPDWTLI